MESKLFAKKRIVSKLYAISIVISLITFLQITLIRLHVKTVDQKSTPILVNTNCRVSVQIVREITRAHQSYVLNTLKYWKESERITCVSSMKLFSINCQSWRTAKSNFSSIVDTYEIDILCLTETFENEWEPVQFRQWSRLKS